MARFIVGGLCACGEYTEWACADCKIDTGKSVYVCATEKCRMSHEIATCSKPNPAVRYLPKRKS